MTYPTEDELMRYYDISLDEVYTFDHVILYSKEDAEIKQVRDTLSKILDSDIVQADPARRLTTSLLTVFNLQLKNPPPIDKIIRYRVKDRLFNSKEAAIAYAIKADITRQVAPVVNPLEVLLENFIIVPRI